MYFSANGGPMSLQFVNGSGAHLLGFTADQGAYPRDLVQHARGIGDSQHRLRWHPALQRWGRQGSREQTPPCLVGAWIRVFKEIPLSWNEKKIVKNHDGSRGKKQKTYHDFRGFRVGWWNNKSRRVDLVGSHGDSDKIIFAAATLASSSGVTV